MLSLLRNKWKLRHIPKGSYCYRIAGIDKNTGHLKVKSCPYHDIDPGKPSQNNGVCTLFDIRDSRDGTLLWDSVKECGEKT